MFSAPCCSRSAEAASGADIPSQACPCEGFFVASVPGESGSAELTKPLSV